MQPSDSLIPKYSELIYNGFWFSPERQALQALIVETQRDVTGLVRPKLYKGNIIVAGRKSPKSLYDQSNRDDGTGRICLRPKRRHGIHPAQCVAIETASGSQRRFA